MKHILTLILIALSFCAFSQQPISGDKLWKGQQFYANNIKYDTGSVDTSLGFFLKIDTTNADSTGYFQLILGAETTTGTVTGTGSNTKVPIWTSGSNLSFDSDFGYTTASDRLAVAAPTGSIQVGTNFIQASINTLGIEIPENDSVVTFTTNAITAKENLFTDDSTFIDTLVYPTSSHGYALTLDTTGAGADGYFRIKPLSFASGTGVANQVAFWSGPGALTGSSSFIYNNSTGAFSIAAGSSTTPFSVTGADADTLRLLSGKYFQTSSAVNLLAATGDGINLYINGNLTGPKISITTSGTVVNANTLAATNFSVASLAGTAMMVDVSNNRLGIFTVAPQNKLHIVCGSTTFLRLDSPSMGTPAAGAAVINNLPSDATTTPVYVKISIDGQTGYVPVFLVP